jgi:iron transport multicopper oxidase
MEKDSQLLESSSEMRFVGLCTGGLAAVAAASVTCVSELLRLVPEFVRISLRLGVAASQRSRNIEFSKGNWAIAVNRHSFDEMRCIIENFHQSQVSLKSAGRTTSTLINA